MVDPGETLLEKCARCHLFVRRDSVSTAGVARFVHVRADADEVSDASHEARGSGRLATLGDWRDFGPTAMRARLALASAVPVG